jgi:hypothetical protein
MEIDLSLLLCFKFEESSLKIERKGVRSICFLHSLFVIAIISEEKKTRKRVSARLDEEQNKNILARKTKEDK